MIIDKADKNSIALCARAIMNGECVVIPCDTIYGLSSLYITGYKKLQALKGRDAGKPFLVLATLEQAQDICVSIPDDVLKCWPASLTVILNTKTGEKLGIRVPDDPWLQELLRTIGKPIYSTSVNISGEPSLLNFDDIYLLFGERVALCVKGFDVQGTTPSTLIDATVLPYKLLRQGSYDISNLIKN